MSMFCYQCQEAAKGTGCTIAGMCGKKEDTAKLQDLLVYVVKGLAVVADDAAAKGKLDNSVGLFISQALFATITNANFDNDRFMALIKEAIVKRDSLKLVIGFSSNLDCVNWIGSERNSKRKAPRSACCPSPTRTSALCTNCLSTA